MVILSVLLRLLKVRFLYLGLFLHEVILFLHGVWFLHIFFSFA